MLEQIRALVPSCLVSCAHASVTLEQDPGISPAGLEPAVRDLDLVLHCRTRTRIHSPSAMGRSGPT